MSPWETKASSSPRGWTEKPYTMRWGNDCYLKAHVHTCVDQVQHVTHFQIYRVGKARTCWFPILGPTPVFSAKDSRMNKRQGIREQEATSQHCACHLCRYTDYIRVNISLTLHTHAAVTWHSTNRCCHWNVVLSVRTRSSNHSLIATVCVVYTLNGS